MSRGTPNIGPNCQLRPSGRSKRVVGGKEVSDKEHPWAVNFLYNGTKVLILALFILAPSMYVNQIKYKYTTECSLNIVFFPRIVESLPPLPRQHSAAIGCTKNYQPIIGMIVNCVESFEGLLQQCRRGGGVAVNCEKHNFS